MNKCPSSIRCRDSNPRPFKHESPPITTRPGLPPFGVIIERNFFALIVLDFTCFVHSLVKVCPVWAIFHTLGNFSKPGAINHQHILGNLCKGVKIFHFTREIRRFGQLLKTFGDFLLVTLLFGGV